MGKLKKISLFIFLTSFFSFSQENKAGFSGMVKDTNGVELPFASLRIAESSAGTMCDKNGRFELFLPKGKYSFIFSYIGFKPKIVFALLDSSLKNNEVILSPINIQLPEVVIDGEDPSFPIIREAISRKKKWQNSVASYKARVYTKDTFGTDTSLGLISEAYSDLYWRKNDTLKEVVVYRRQSSNLPEELQFAMVRDLINFNNDTIRHWGYTFIAPLADSAFQFYDYKLHRTYYDANRKYYDIEVIPLFQTRPLFFGNIIISDSSYALQSVKLHPNNIFKIPFLDLINYEFSQQFSLYENRFWFPLEYHILAEMKFQYMAMEFKNSLYYNKSVICYEYVTNPEIRDSIITLPSITLLPFSKNDDTSQWKNIAYFPLSKFEEDSYEIIDKKVKANPFLFKPFSYLEKYRNPFNIVDIRYNRVEGFYLGGKISSFSMVNFRFSANAGYGFSDRSVKYSFQPEVLLNPKLSIWFGVENYREMQTFPLNYHINEFLNSISALFNGIDYYHYSYNRGNRIFLNYDKYSEVQITLSFVVENQTSALKNTNFALNFIGSNKKFHDNLSITEGRLHAFQFELSNKQETVKNLFEEQKNTWYFRAEHSSPNYGSTFNFSSFYSNCVIRIPTIGTSRLFNPYLGISASFGKSFGSVPIQKIFALESPLSKYVYPGSFRTVKNFEYFGDNFYTLSIEYNYRNIPFILLGIPSINIDLITRIATSDMRINSSSLKNTLQTLTTNYNEYTIGIGRVFDIFRIDFSYSDYHNSHYALTFAGYL